MAANINAHALAGFKNMVKNDKDNFNYIVSISPFEERDVVKISVVFIGCQNHKFIGRFVYRSPKAFVDGIQELLNGTEIKAVVAEVFYVKAVDDFKNNLKFCEAIKEKLDENGLKYFFINFFSLQNSEVLCLANLTAKINDKILIIRPNNDGTNYLFKLEFTEEGYKYILFDDKNYEIIQSGALRNETFDDYQNIILSSRNMGDKNILQLKNEILSEVSEKIVIQEGIKCYHIETNVKICDWICDTTLNNFHIVPTSEREYCIGLIYNSRQCYLYYFDKTLLPFEKKIIGQRFGSFKYFVGYLDEEKEEMVVIEYLDIQFNNYEINFKIDLNNFITWEVQENEQENRGSPDEFKLMPHICDAEMPSKIPIICFWNNRAFVLNDDKDEGYFFVSENLFAKRVVISFVEDKPKIGDEAMADYQTSSTFVVGDLLDIISFEDADNIIPRPQWDFTIFKNPEYPILIQHETTEGQRFGTPAFYMGIFLNNIVKEIQSESGGEKPKKVGFYLIGIDNSVAVKKALREACKFLKIECTFF